MIETVSNLTLLEELEINIPVQISDINDDFLQLDRLRKIKGWFWPFLSKIEETPLLIGRTKNVLFDKPVDEAVKVFRDKFKDSNMSKEQLELLFGIHVKNYTALNAILPNALKASLEEKKPVNLILLDKPKGESAKSIKENLGSHNITITGQSENQSIIVIGVKTILDEAEPYVEKGYKLITVDHLKDVLVAVADPWLMQKDNESSNTQLMQLLASNQTENYQIAFQIIEGGGANKTIQSLLAAIMLSHPESSIYKTAEKLYDKYGSQSFKVHAKNTKISFRKSGDTEKKVNIVVNHPDIDAFTFRLMHHCIAGSNKNIADVQPKIFRLKDVKNVEISETLPFFTHFEEIHFDNCQDLKFEKGIPLLKQMTWCKVLNINNCRINVPDTISELDHLNSLDLGFNIVLNPNCLEKLKSLRHLNIEGTKLAEWKWLKSLCELEYINVNNCALLNLPQEIYSIKTLTTIIAKQNKIKQIEEIINELVNLKLLDFSNNQLTSFPYFLAKLPNLTTLLLRSNSIPEFDSSKVINVANTNSFSWVEFNLSRNGLSKFSFGNMMLPALRVLDISYNEISMLDNSIFASGSLSELYAECNKISAIPPAISKVTHFTKLWLHKNQIARLEDYMAGIRIENCDLSDNQISFIHPDFDSIGKDGYARLYWKIRNNPISATLNNFGGLYGR